MNDNITDAEIVDEGTGEIITALQVPSMSTALVTTEGRFAAIASTRFDDRAVALLMADAADADVEIRPDGLIYLPEIKYRRVLNNAFGPGSWGMLPVDIGFSEKESTLYYRGALFVNGRFVSESIGEAEYHDSNKGSSHGTAAESAKSNCLMRCCKDLGISSNLWDPTFIEEWKGKYAVKIWCEYVGKPFGTTQKGDKKPMWRKKVAPKLEYPWKEEAPGGRPPQEAQPRETTQHAPDTRRVDPLPSQPPTNGSQNSNGNGNLDLRLITTPQVGRYKAIAVKNGWIDDELKFHLKSKYNYEKPEVIQRHSYESICNDLMDESCHLLMVEGCMRAKESQVQEKGDGLPF